MASALGVAVLVRNYLWNRNLQEVRAMAEGVERFLENRAERVGPPVRGNRLFNRGLRRFSRGGAQLVLIKDGAIVLDDEDPERDWSGIISSVQPGFQAIEFDEENWQVLARDVKSPLADRFLIIRPWSPSIKLVRTLVLYQILASIIVMGLALMAVSYFASRLARPLEELRKKTKAVGRTQIKDLQSSKVVEISDLQESFIQMSRRVEEAMTSQRQFVADASHELKTPLTAISGMLELLQSRQDMDEEDRVQALSVAKTEADRMESLIADLLLLSRAQARRSGEKTKVLLADIVLREMATLKLLFPEQEFRLTGETKLTHIMNADAFSRIARNLMENAARYAGKGPIELNFEETSEGIVFKVKDQGPGIPQDKLALLFERFYRTDAGRARSEGGHGLGLAIVKALVEEAGGNLSCQSSEGQGSEFRVLFSKS